MFVHYKKYSFPCPWTSEIMEDVIAVGGPMDVTSLIESYSLGIFPWPHDGYPLLWFCPESRGIIDFSDLRVNRSTSKWLKKNELNYHIQINTDFESIIINCQKAKRKDQKGSWINDDIIKSYKKLFDKGHMICLGVYKNENLVGGIYGVLSKKYFSAESMFHLEDNVSKMAFIKLIEILKSKGHSWMDIQMVTDVCSSLGAKYISREDFLTRIQCPVY